MDIGVDINHLIGRVFASTNFTPCVSEISQELLSAFSDLGKPVLFRVNLLRITSLGFTSPLTNRVILQLT